MLAPSVRAGRGSRGYLLLAAAAIAAALAATAAAQDEETTIQANISIINISVPYQPSVYLVAFYKDGVIHARVSIANVEGTPMDGLVLEAGSGGRVYFSTEVSFDSCGPVVCYADYEIPPPPNSTIAWVALVHTGLVVQNVTIILPREARLPVLTGALLSAAVIATLAVRGSIVESGLGMLAAGVIVYLLSLAGFADASPVFVVIPIIVGALLLWVKR